MPQALPELIASIRRALDESIRPELSTDFALVQLAGMQDILAKLERMVVWSPDLFRQRLSAMQSGVDRMVALASDHGYAPGIDFASVRPAQPIQSQLGHAQLEQAVRAVEQHLALWTDWLFDPANILPVALRQQLDAILRATLREEVLAERRMVPRGDFLAMTAASEAGQRREKLHRSDIMLSAQDDLIGHQTPTPFSQAGNGDLRYTERYWYTAHPIDGSDMIIDMGMGYYPNRGVMDAFAGITVGRVQYSFRASRQLADQPLQTAVGPISFQVLEGMKRHRLWVADNESGFSCDIEFEASFPAAREKQNYRERHGVVEEDLLRMAQFGRFRGWFVINGQRHVVEPSRWWGQRDHSWGLRTQLRTDSAHPPMSPLKNFFWTWSMLQFENMGLSVFFREREPGKPGYLSGSEFVRAADGQVHKREVIAVAHDVQWLDDPLGQTIASASLRFDFDHGLPRDVKLDGLTPRFYLKAGLYGGLNGWQHGDDRGAYASAHEVWNLDDAATRRIACTLSDQVMRATSDGMVGYGISEYGVADGYPLYLAAQKFPAF